MAIKTKIITKNGIQEKTLTPIKAIRQKCLECSNWSSNEVKKCEMTDCALFVYRSGKTGQKRILTDEQKKAVADRFKISKLNRKASRGNRKLKRS